MSTMDDGRWQNEHDYFMHRAHATRWHHWAVWIVTVLVLAELWALVAMAVHA